MMSAIECVQDAVEVVRKSSLNKQEINTILITDKKLLLNFLFYLIYVYLTSYKILILKSLL